MKRSWFSSDNLVPKERFSRRYFRHLGIGYEDATQIFSRTTVHVAPLVDIDTAPLVAFLQDLDVTVTQKNPDIVLPVTDSFLASPRLDTLIASSLSAGAACLPLELGITSMVGPFLSPSSTISWACIKNSLNRHNAIPELIARMLPEEATVAHEVAYPELVLNGCFHHALQALLNVLFNKTKEEVLSVRNHATGITEHCEFVHWVPARAYLAPKGEQESTHLELNLNQSMAAIDATATDTTLKKNVKTLQSITNPYTGVIATLTPIKTDENEAGLFRVASRHPLLNRLGQDDPAKLLGTLHYNTNVQSSALGTDPQRTLVRAGNEAYEKCAAAFRGDEYHVMATYEELGDNALKNTSLFPLTIHNDAEVPELPESESMAWIPTWSLTYKKRKWIPAAYCYFGFPSGKQYARTNTRGIAAGPTLEFCVLKGLAELIETLAYTRWEQDNTPVPEVAIAGFQNPLYDAIQQYHTNKGRELWVLDLSRYAAGGFSAYAALSHNPTDDSLLRGTAAGHTPEQAIRSALLECTQMLPNLLLPLEEQKKSNVVRFGVGRREARGKSRGAGDLGRGAGDLGRGLGDLGRGLGDLGWEAHASPCLREVVAQLQDEGIEVLAKDLTRDEVAIRVARVIFGLKTPARDKIALRMLKE